MSVFTPWETGATRLRSYNHKEVKMRVSVYKLDDGRMDVLVEASPGSGKAPVVIQGVTQEDLVQRVGPVVDAQRGHRDLTPF